jgi:DNA processing protein
VNKLIQDGATPVLEVTDILKALNLFMVPQQLEMQAILPDNDDERVLLKLISHDPRHIDELIRESGLSTTTVSSTLAMMELKGMVKQVGGMQYVLAR